MVVPKNDHSSSSPGFHSCAINPARSLGDGGYLIPDDFDDTVACFSPGVSSISGFESDCTDRNIRVYFADATVDAPALESPLFEFSKKFVGGDAKGDFITLDQRVKES